MRVLLVIRAFLWAGSEGWMRKYLGRLGLCCVLFGGVFGFFGASAVLAASTVDTFRFASAEHEQRYRGLIAEIRCPKCQNVNIAGSDAPIAKDLRVTVHRLLSEGLSDAQILAFLQERYGDFVLYDPPLRGNTLVLWLVPLLGFLVSIVVVLQMARRTPDVSDLSAADTERLQGLLDRTDDVTEHKTAIPTRTEGGQA